MDRNSVKEIVYAMGEKQDVEILECKIKKSSDGTHLVIVLWSEKGISMDDCAEFSRALGNQLDEKDPIEESYFLEVASPGLDRPIKTADDCRRNLGKEVEAKLYVPVDGNKQFQGKIIDYSEDAVVLETEEKKVTIPLDKISKMVRVIQF